MHPTTAYHPPYPHPPVPDCIDFLTSQCGVCLLILPRLTVLLVGDRSLTQRNDTTSLGQHTVVDKEKEEKEEKKESTTNTRVQYHPIL